MPSRRIERVNELLLRSISQYVLERQHPDMGFITFTGVKTSDDLSVARVYYSVLGSDEEKSRSAQVLQGLRHDLYVALRPLESLKRIPDLEFVFDDTPAKAARVSEILEQIHHETEPQPKPAVPHARRSQRKKTK
jgi:ribosome-binding factor A